MSRSKYDNKGMKFLRIKNWKKYQPDGRLRNKDARLLWIRDYTEKLDNYEFTQLTFFQRHLFEAICLLVATSSSRTVHNDPTHISRATHAQATDIPHVGHALSTLISRGFLIPTNTEKFFDEDDENMVREGEREGEGDREGEGSKLVGKLVSSDENEEQEEIEYLNEETPVSELPCFELLHSEFGIEHRLQENIIRRVHTALTLLGKNEVWMQGCIQHAANHKWWKTRVFNPATFADALEKGIEDPDNTKLPAQYNVVLAQRKAMGAGKR